MSRFVEQLAQRVLFFDGAMGTSIHAQDLSLERDYLGKENCTEILVQTRPEVIQSIHESFLAAGADAVETDTFGANRLVLAEFDLAEQAYQINKEAARIARAACARFATSEQPRFVIGSIGPGTKLLSLGHTTWDQMSDSYREQARGLIDGGVDVLLIETCQDLLQVKCAVGACLAALNEAGKTTDDVPLMVQVTIETTGTMLLGTEIGAAAAALEGFPIFSLGINCATGPVEMTEHIHWLGRNWPKAVSVLPNAGLPVLVDGRTEYPLKPEPFAESMVRFVEHDGVNIVGGCCGTTPAHIKALIETIGRRRPARSAQAGPKPACSSLYSPVEYRQESSILNIGERTNASGSRAFKRMLEQQDWDAMVGLARQQVREGSHVIDVNVDYAGRDNARDMAEIVQRFVRQVNVALMIDSAQPATIEAGLRQAGGKCIINSANLEEGESKFGLLCGLARKYNAAVVLGCIDEDQEQAMARTADRKAAIARRMYDLAVNRHGLAPEDLFFDPLVLPISTGMDADRRSGLETIEGVRRIRAAFPQCQTTAGVSNVSFGLRPAARVVLNSVFLHELIEAGLTSAIIHVSKILPRNKISDERWDAALDLIYDRRAKGFDPLQRFIDLFSDDEAGAETTKKDVAALSLEERLQAHIIDGEKQDLAQTLDQALEKYAPLDIINDHLLAGMKVVGDLFGSGQMQLPFVLQSAEVMKQAVTYLEPHMDRTADRSKGSIVLATVRGDVHDIGKNLVDIILSNNGYTVHNLGIKQPILNIIEKWRQTRADAIGLSGLLVKSVQVMAEDLEVLNERGIRVPVLLGGAALSRHYCEGGLRQKYSGEVFYGRDAFEGLRIMDLLTTGKTEVLKQEIEERLGKRAETEARIEAAAAGKPLPSDAPAGPALPPAEVPAPPFWGHRVIRRVRLDDVFAFVNTVALFRGQWQFKRGRLTDEQYQAQLEDEVLPLFERIKRQCCDEKILKPQVVYGYFPCNSDGDDLIVYDPVDQDRPVERFTFPRQKKGKRLCISDFFRPADSGQKDVLGLFCVTMGPEVSRRTKALFDSDDYRPYLYLHGMGVECAEALAEMWHKRMRQELGIAGQDKPTIRELFNQGYRGSRYSFGYPACPEMSDQQKLFRLIDPGRIGCVLTENHQIDPEQSTSAIVVHHPAARYFNV